MTSYEIYVFILCLIVFTMFTALFSYVIYTITKMRLKMIAQGLEDEQITKEYLKETGKSRFVAILSKALSLLVCVVLIVIFLFCLYMNINRDKAPNGIPSFKVVKSSSMANKNEKNTYLFKNNLNDQIKTFDLIVTHHLPEEENLKLYDVVVYKRDDSYIIHRIIGIEEPNEKHPNCRHFLLQGDNVLNPDQFPVLYSQMQGIYKGERVPFVGSFILFIQSPAGWLCVILVLFATITSPILEKKLNEEIKSRSLILGLSDKKDKKAVSKKEKAPLRQGGKKDD